MALTKGTDVVALRKLLKERGLDHQVVARLSGDALGLYQKALASDWSPVTTQMLVYLAAAETMFPGAAEPMRELGRALAERAYTGVYRIFLRLPTVRYVLSRAAQLWRTYYDTGQGEVHGTEPGSVRFVVRGFPDLPAPMREMAAGHMDVLLRMTGARAVRIDRDDANPDAWAWQLTWE